MARQYLKVFHYDCGNRNNGHRRLDKNTKLLIEVHNDGPLEDISKKYTFVIDVTHRPCDLLNQNEANALDFLISKGKKPFPYDAVLINGLAKDYDFVIECAEEGLKNDNWPLSKILVMSANRSYDRNSNEAYTTVKADQGNGYLSRRNAIEIIGIMYGLLKLKR